ncbi:5'-deoxynucleotidase [Oscillibacter sp. MSJ-2]|uniref:5'-deoxynucleotidase n=1 Tax=Dysosmobacter acutus TaxID=2841504 RepID=A0ABS6FEQ7_9FIRM|nr:5'-deoxynucleotidase [Dysosmobacter acutus]MBU5628121.1 5'-deoxynucleotidase [Dysosmobacter acutus]
MKHYFFAYMFRMRFIARWALMRNSFPENVQEHSHQVAVLAHALATIRRDVFHKKADPNACAAAALFHDASEILTGDLPTPVKYNNPAIQQAYKALEVVAQDKLLQGLPEELKPAYTPILHEEDEEVRKIVKAADKLSAYLKCQEELHAGNQEFEQAALEIMSALQSYRMPEVAWFLEKFGNTFGVTLDELR